MAEKTSRTVADPDLAFFGTLIKRQALLEMNCHSIGTIQSFDSTNQSAKISINYKRTVKGELADYPPLVDCPVIFLGGGDGHLTFPVEAGDTCLVFFNDRNMDIWVASGNVGAAPDDERAHAFADAIALVGLRAFPHALANFKTDGVGLYFGSTLVELDTKVKIANGTTDLKTLINGLIDLIAAATVTVSGVPTPLNNASAISAYKTTIAGLLK